MKILSRAGFITSCGLNRKKIKIVLFVRVALITNPFLSFFNLKFIWMLARVYNKIKELLFVRVALATNLLPLYRSIVRG